MNLLPSSAPSLHPEISGFYQEKMTKYLQLIFLMTVIGLHTGEHLTNNDNGKQKLFFITSLGPAVFNRRENQDSIND